MTSCLILHVCCLDGLCCILPDLDLLSVVLHVSPHTRWILLASDAQLISLLGLAYSAACEYETCISRLTYF